MSGLAHAKGVATVCYRQPLGECINLGPGGSHPRSCRSALLKPIASDLHLTERQAKFRSPASSGSEKPSSCPRDEAGRPPQPFRRFPLARNRLSCKRSARMEVQRESRDTVTIVLNSDRSTKPLVTLASPGMPTAVLSLPSPPTTGALSPQRPSLSQVEITTIDAETGGRLMVSGRSRIGGTRPLPSKQLSQVAPAEASGEGRVSFAIGQGVQPGAYRIRLDEVDPTSGEGQEFGQR